MNTMFTDRLRIKELEETLVNSTPLLAVVGAGDLAVEKIRAAREEFASRSANFDPKAFRDQAQATFTQRVEAFQNDVSSAPEQFKALPEKAQDWPAKAQALFADIVATAFTTYGDLAGRGKGVVSSFRADHSVVDHAETVTRPAAAKSTSSSTSTKSTAKKPAAKKPAAKKTSTRTTKKASPSKKTSSSTSRSSTSS